MRGHRLDINSVLNIELEALLNEILAFVRYHSLLGGRKFHAIGLEHDSLM